MTLPQVGQSEVANRHEGEALLKGSPAWDTL